MRDYVVQHTPRSHCKYCERGLDMLCREDGKTACPWFYICFDCRKVYKLGEGEVKRVKSTDTSTNR